MKSKPRYLEAFIRGIITSIALTVAINWGQHHPLQDKDMVVVKINAGEMQILQPQNNSTFTCTAETSSRFVFPRDTVLYTIQLRIRPGPKTPEDIFKRIDNLAMSN
jgi:hypothetical protein